MNNEKELRKEFEIWYLNNKNQGLNDIADWWIEKMANQLQETSLDQYAMGQSEGMDYHEFKMKELWYKCEEAKQNFETEDFIRAICDIQQLLTNK